MGFSFGGLLTDITKDAFSYDQPKASDTFMGNVIPSSKAEIQPTANEPTLLDRVGTALKDTGTAALGSAGTLAQNWVQKQAQEQLLDPLERELFKPQNTGTSNIQEIPTTGQSPVTNVPSVSPVLFDYKPASSGGNTAVFYIVGGAVIFLTLIFLLKK